MNQLNEKLRFIRIQKSVYQAMLKLNEDYPREIEKIKNRIEDLEKEETDILNQLGVDIDSNNR